MARARLQATVSGRVQGIGFRHFVFEHAERLDLTGWVRNTADRKVEVVAEGERDDLERLLAQLRQGPLLARVQEVQFSWSKDQGEFDAFRVRG